MGGRTVIDELRVDKYTINDIFVNYIKDKFYINRRYQRKLVWETHEKQLLIDSILKGIPIPAVLIAEYKTLEDNRTVLEIVDGMQRLDAIISFMLGKYGVEYGGKICYFDPNSYPETFNLMNSNEIKYPTPYLPKEMCQDFYRYQIPAIITGQDDDTINLIFSRINSTGRKISSHDLRQSTSVGTFSDLVRRVASRIRGDYTYDDKICLCDMPKISVGLKRFGYGVDIDSVFWRRHDLITSFNMKESSDEEIIETLIATVLLKEKFKKSKKSLDNLYDISTPLGKEIDNIILDMGKEKLEDDFSKVFDEIDMIFSSVESNFSEFIFSEKRVVNKDECFKMLYLVLYNLMSNGYIITDYERVANSIKDAKSVFIDFTKQIKVNYNDINKGINNLYKILKNDFAYKVALKSSDIEKEIDKRLSYSKIERQMTEFKIGISDFSSNSINMNVIHDISKTLVGMSNTTNVKETGILIIGIANDKQSYDDWNYVYNEPPIICNQHYVTGITSEAIKLCKNTDCYYRKIRKLIESEPISRKLKNYILETFETFDYHGKELIIFRSENVGEISLYNNEKYVRHSNETLKFKDTI